MHLDLFLCKNYQISVDSFASCLIIQIWIQIIYSRIDAVYNFIINRHDSNGKCMNHFL